MASHVEKEDYETIQGRESPTSSIDNINKMLYVPMKIEEIRRFVGNGRKLTGLQELLLSGNDIDSGSLFEIACIAENFNDIQENQWAELLIAITRYGSANFMVFDSVAKAAEKIKNEDLRTNVFMSILQRKNAGEATGFVIWTILDNAERMPPGENRRRIISAIIEHNRLSEDVRLRAAGCDRVPVTTAFMRAERVDTGRERSITM